MSNVRCEGKIGTSYCLLVSMLKNSLTITYEEISGGSEICNSICPWIAFFFSAAGLFRCYHYEANEAESRFIQNVLFVLKIKVFN